MSRRKLGSFGKAKVSCGRFLLVAWFKFISVAFWRLKGEDGRGNPGRCKEGGGGARAVGRENGRSGDGERGEEEVGDRETAAKERVFGKRQGADCSEDRVYVSPCAQVSSEASVQPSSRKSNIKYKCGMESDGGGGF